MTVHLRHAAPTGREMREPENRLRNARRACTCCPQSDDSCAPVRVATSRVDPPPKCWPTVHLRHATPMREKPKVAKLPAPSRHRSPTISHTVRGHGHTPAAVSRWSKSGHVDHSRHFRASLPTQEPHPHGGPLFLGCATCLSRTTSASTDAATSWVGSTHNGRAQQFTSMPCGRRPRNSRVHHRRRQLLHRPQTASEAAGSAPCPSAAHALGLEHAPP